MMCSVTVIILHAFIAQAHGKASDTEDLMDNLANKLVDKLFGSAMSKQSMMPRSLFLAPPSASQRSTQMQAMHVQDKLKMYGVRSSPLENLALTAISANVGAQRGDISAKASKAEVVSGWSTVDGETKRKLSNVLEDVKSKAGKDSLLAGITAPLGYFDPLGLATTVTAGKLLFYREVELKHGRVAMLASLGMLIGEQFHPLFGGDINVPAYIAFQQTPLETFWPAVVAAIAIPEIFSVFTFQEPNKGEMWAMKEDHVPGDLGFDPLGLKPTDPQELKDMQAKELNNGRLAMIAAAGMIAQEIATGQKLF